MISGWRHVQAAKKGDSSMTTTTEAQKILRAIRTTDYTDGDVAKAIGAHRSTVCKIRNGQLPGDRSLPQLRDLAHDLGIDLRQPYDNPSPTTSTARRSRPSHVRTRRHIIVKPLADEGADSEYGNEDADENGIDASDPKRDAWWRGWGAQGYALAAAALLFLVMLCAAAWHANGQLQPDLA